jgi:hypothetical protein
MMPNGCLGSPVIVSLRFPQRGLKAATKSNGGSSLDRVVHQNRLTKSAAAENFLVFWLPFSQEWRWIF